jgi:hypothetical protein
MISESYDEAAAELAHRSEVKARFELVLELLVLKIDHISFKMQALLLLLKIEHISFKMQALVQGDWTIKEYWILRCRSCESLSHDWIADSICGCECISI